tara:strand:+ start:5673 stop:7112 length:1440 start_codon:yes stop_codon:yes gene_type:complete
MKSKEIVPIILCGGSGKRLWPLSRASFPKQYIALSGESKDTLLQKTIKRISNIENISEPLFICNEEHRFITAEQIKSIKSKLNKIILEPEGRGTTPAIAIAALKLFEEKKDPLLLVLSSDHEIDDLNNFKKSIEVGIQCAKNGRLVTFGIIPTSAETAFGYIKAKDSFMKTSIRSSEIINFIEKPNKKTAKELIKDGSYTWNSGIFLFKASAIINEINKFSPEIIKSCKLALDSSEIDLDFQRVNKKSFLKCEKSSIDISVMEKTDLGTVVPMNAGWKDIGSWKQLWESEKKDENGNAKKGKVYLKDTYNSLFRAENKLVVGLGVENLIMVETRDAVIVLDKDLSQNVKEIVEELDQNNFSEGLEHKKIYRPWGDYESLIENINWKVKKIVVKPYQSLSLQMHNNRSEHWIVVSGTAKVEINGIVKFLNKDQSAYIPQKSKHRLSNPKKETLVLIEVQSGDYLGEDDIIRFQDNYGRVK